MREFFTFLPANSQELPKPVTICDLIDDVDESLNTLVPTNPNTPYDIYELIEKVCDERKFFALKPDFARNIIIGFGRIGGNTIWCCCKSTYAPCLQDAWILTLQEKLRGL